MLTAAGAKASGEQQAIIIHNVTGYTLVPGSIAEDSNEKAKPGSENSLKAADPNRNAWLPDAATLKQFEAIAIQDGRVLLTGTRSELNEKYPDAKLIDGNGHALLPGLTDAHVHIMGLGEANLNVNVMGLQSLEETLQKVEAYAQDYPDLPWIRGRGWNQVLWDEDRFPTAEDLDKVVPDRPVWLTRVDGHAGWANSKALEIAGVTKETTDPDGGSVIRDDDGEPTGVFIDRAMDLIRDHIPPPREAERKMALEAALDKLRSEGLTGVHDAGLGFEDVRLMKEFADKGKLTTRVYGMTGGAGDDFDRLSGGEMARRDKDRSGQKPVAHSDTWPESGPVDGYADDRLFLRSVKLYTDGALGSRGAALLDDYSDDPGNRGLLLLSHEELTEKIRKIIQAGFQPAVHAIGDEANRMVLDVFENAAEESGVQQNNSDAGIDARLNRPRIEHAQVVHPDDIPRFDELGVIASMQPVHATSDMNMAEDRIGRDRMKGAYAWRTILEQNIMIASGSDFPVELSNPFHGLYSAVTRRDHEGNPEGGWYPEQRLSRKEALHSFTLGAAYAGFMEDRTGSLEPGKWADFILVDKDFFEIPESEIHRIEVVETWLAGEKVYP